MRVNTQILKTMLNKVSGCKPSKILEISNYYLLEFTPDGLKIHATDGINFIDVTSTDSKMSSDDGIVGIIVKADQFSKLINKTTKDEILLTVKDNYLEVKGNGTYKVEIVENETYPSLDVNKDVEFEVKLDSLTKAINGGKNAKSTVLNDGVLYNYLLRDECITTADAIKVYNRSVEGMDMENIEILIPPALAQLLSSLDSENVKLYMDGGTTLMAVGKDVIIKGALDENVSNYPNLNELFSCKYPYTAEIDVKQVIDAIERLNLFITTYDNGIITVLLDGTGMTIATASDSLETINWINPTEVQEPFIVNVNSQYLKDLFSSLEGEKATVEFGIPDTIMIGDMNVTLILATADEDD